jgi:hypothetical protein
VLTVAIRAHSFTTLLLRETNHAAQPISAAAAAVVLASSVNCGYTSPQLRYTTASSSLHTAQPTSAAAAVVLASCVNCGYMSPQLFYTTAN